MVDKLDTYMMDWKKVIRNGNSKSMELRDSALKLVITRGVLRAVHTMMTTTPKYKDQLKKIENWIEVSKK